MKKTSRGRKPMTMKQWEASPMDRKADKAGKHGKEGSSKDRAADKRGLAKYNAAHSKKGKSK